MDAGMQASRLPSAQHLRAATQGTRPFAALDSMAARPDHFVAAEALPRSMRIGCTLQIILKLSLLQFLIGRVDDHERTVEVDPPGDVNGVPENIQTTTHEQTAVSSIQNLTRCSGEETRVKPLDSKKTAIVSLSNFDTGSV